MTEATQLELDFVRWLGELSADVPQRYGRWLETEDGACSDGEYCVECIDAEVTDRKSKEDPYIEIHGWNEAMETDSISHCERCGVMIHHSPTRYYIEEDIKHLPRIKKMTPDEAAIFHNWLSGMGGYDQAEHWPLIKPHAERLMSDAGCVVVPDGSVTFRPIDTILNRNWYSFDSIWLSVYQHFGKKLVHWMGKENNRYEVLVDTSGIHCTDFEEFSDEKQPHRCLHKLFLHVGLDTTHGQFLASIGLKSLADLEQPIQIADDRCERPTYGVRGRILKGIPNKCHPDARTVTHAELQLSTDAKRWCYRLYYDYTHHDRSSWNVATAQKKGQSLRDFMASIPNWMDEVLEPACPDDQFRSHRMKQWDKSHAALRNVFYFTECEDDVALTDILHGREYGAVLLDGRIRLDRRRLATLKRWISEDTKRHAEQQAQREARTRR